MTPETSQKPRLLILDDDEHVRSALSRLFRRSGFDVGTASNAERVLGHLREGVTYDCLIVDLLMPGMNGRQFVEAIREEDLLPLERIIVLTAVHNADNATAYLQYGCASYCGKPWRNARILQQVRRVCGLDEGDETLDGMV